MADSTDERIIEELSLPPMRRPLSISLPDKDQVIALGVRMLNERALVWLGTITAAALWGYAVWHPEPLRLLASGLFCVTTLVPIIWYARS
jgi:hypothetical protein